MPIDVPVIVVDFKSLQSEIDRDTYDRVGYELLARAGMVCEQVIEQTALEADGTRRALTIDEATLGGLLVRTWKLLRNMFASTQEEDSESHQILGRCAVETAINLSWIVAQADPDEYKRFRAASFVTWTKWLAQTPATAADASGHHPDADTTRKKVETYVNAQLAAAGLSPADIPKSPNNWGGGNFRRRLADLGQDGLYLPMFASHSDYVHGSWHEISTFHVNRDNGGYRLETGFGAITPTMMYVTAEICLEAARDYVTAMPVPLVDEAELRDLVDRTTDLVGEMNNAFVGWVARGGLDDRLSG